MRWVGSVKAGLKALYYLAPHTWALDGKRLLCAAILHVERIHDRDTFRNLVEFCRAYKSLTGARPIGALMAPTNPRVARGLAEHGVSLSEFRDRILELKTHLSLGYHGHYWLDPRACFDLSADIRSAQQVDFVVVEQMDRDLRWFRENAIEITSAYAAGWWYVSSFVYERLVERGFRVDFSLSKSPWFFNAWSHNLLVRQRLPGGQPIRYHTREGSSLLCIQNLVGIAANVHEMDINRYLLQLAPLTNEEVIGVFNAHDYDLSGSFGLDFFSSLLEHYPAEVLSLDELVRVADVRALDVPAPGMAESPVLAARA